jgi:hypothetical protein
MALRKIRDREASSNLLTVLDVQLGTPVWDQNAGLLWRIRKFLSVACLFYRMQD